ncbi:MAG: squalene/phytoene synthase family protein [Magnetococcales bacterium]|nr:squalene/phytoene synthase family protein [Magnetococcales bacterium]
MTSAAYCRKKTRQSRSSFYYPLLLAAPIRRDALFALYAFCREVDDLVDGPMESIQAQQQLNGWRKEIQDAFNGQPNHPVGHEINRAQQRFNLPQSLFNDILDGMEMDLNNRRYLTLNDLQHYCQRVSVAVGLLAMRIFLGHGDGHPIPDLILKQGERFAHHLGMAFQYTNILRDVPEDLNMGRIYLPGEMLFQAGVSEEQLITGSGGAGVAIVASQIAALAQDHYQKAAELITPELRPRLVPAAMMAEIYQTYLHRIQQHNFDVFTDSIRFSRMEKLVRIIRVWIREKRLIWMARRT